MTKKISIAIDAMGGDNSPGKTLKGVKIFIEKNKTKKDYVLCLFGNEAQIKHEITTQNIPIILANIL